MIPQEVADIAQILADDADNGCTYEDFIEVAYTIYNYRRNSDELNGYRTN